MARVGTFAFPVIYFLVLAIASGCGGKLPATVTGTITIDGEGLSGVSGDVMFHPSGGGAMAMAPLKDDGSYEINTGSTEGLEPGEYAVTVSVVEIEPPPPGGYQNAPPQKAVAPRRYGDREQSGLSAEVVPGKNVFDFDLLTK